MSRPLVVQTEALDEACRDWLRERCEIVPSAPEDGEAFVDLMSRAEGLLVRTYTRVDGELLARAPKLRVVGRAGVGVDNIDVAACRARGVEVVYTPDANTRAVVELVTAFMLDALRPRVSLDRALALADWKNLRASVVAPRQLAGMTLGILGLGRVGKGLARVGRAMDMRVLYHDLAEIPESDRQGAQSVGVEELFSQAEILSVHIDNRPGNRRFVDGEKLSLLPAGAMFINTSRGFVVDDVALALWLRKNSGARAVLDVHDPEPFTSEYPLLGLANARLTPHIGAATAQAHRNMSWVVRDVWRVLSGERAQFPAPVL
jgi:D-3-phosphoglycerate dehydrogenase